MKPPISIPPNTLALAVIASGLMWAVILVGVGIALNSFSEMMVL